MEYLKAYILAYSRGYKVLKSQVAAGTRTCCWPYTGGRCCSCGLIAWHPEHRRRTSFCPAWSCKLKCLLAKCLRILTMAKSLHLTSWGPIFTIKFSSLFRGVHHFYWVQNSLAASWLHRLVLVSPGWRSLDSRGPHSCQLSRSGVFFLWVSSRVTSPAKKLIFAGGQCTHDCSYNDTLVTIFPAHAKVVLAPSWSYCL